MTSFADNWSSLFELFTSASGLKLRLNMPDTAIIKEGKLQGWWYTNNEGVLTRASLHEISPQGLFQKLVGQKTEDPAMNPFQYIALAHYDSGLSRPLKQQELQQLMWQISGPFEGQRAVDVAVDTPFCLQAYIIPMQDLRYLTTYGGTDVATCTTFARRFSARYSHATDDPATVRHVIARAAANATMRAGGFESGEERALSAEELLVESQLVAMGLLEAREQVDGLDGEEEEGVSYAAGAGVPDVALPASKKAQQETAKAIQGIVSFIERSHGLRVQGIVAEFVQAHPDVFVLLAVHAVQWDMRASRGRLGTFTDRWNDYMNGMGPAPAPRPASRKANAPGLLRSADSSMLIMTERAAGVGLPCNVAQPPATSGRSPPRAPAVNQQHDITQLTAARPGSAPAVVLHRFRPHTASSYGGPNNGNYSLRNAVASARRGAGGNPTASPPTPDSYRLWSPRKSLPTETVTGSLSLEIEVLKEKLQRQADIAARAELALTQLAVSSQATQASLMKQLEDVRAEAAVATQGRQELESEYERLRGERAQLKSELAAVQEELSSSKDQLAADRATLVTTVRSAQSTQGDLEGVTARLKAENESLRDEVVRLQRRLEEEQEVVEAARSQLFDYRQMVTMLQGQLRRGKNKLAAGTASPNAMHVGGSVTSLPANLVSAGAAQHAGRLSLLNPSGIGSGREDPLAPIDLDTSMSLHEAPVSHPGSHAHGAGTQAIRYNSARSKSALNSSTAGAQPSSGHVKRDGMLGGAAQPAATSASGSVQGQAAANGAPALLRSPSASMISAMGAPANTGAAATGGMTGELMRTTLAELRRARKFGALDSGPQSIVGQQMVGASPSAGTASGGGKDGGKEGAIEKAAPRVFTNPWKPLYEQLHLGDLFVGTGELTERMTETLSYLLKFLASVEAELFDIFSYYGVLSKVRYVDSKLAMSEHQFVKLGRDCGLTTIEHIEDVYRVVADRTLAYHFDVEGAVKEEFITFPEFPEAVCRLAATKYEWRPPENPDDAADDDIEQPEALRNIDLANISELPNANHYGVGPTAKPPPPPSPSHTSGPGSERQSRPASAVSARSGRQRSASPSRSPSRPGTARKPSPSPSPTRMPWESANADKYDDDDCTRKPVVSPLGPQPPDVVLYTLIKTFVLNDLLPNAKRSNISGSVRNKQRSQERTAPSDVWL